MKTIYTKILSDIDNEIIGVSKIDDSGTLTVYKDCIKHASCILRYEEDKLTTKKVFKEFAIKTISKLNEKIIK